ncbi:MAG: hypothetical protein HS113_20650 [Verrucomicrobiales bacterium]|nr:hypothetical protein [Verrucomicrobiales bacterium]
MKTTSRRSHAGSELVLWTGRLLIVASMLASGAGLLARAEVLWRENFEDAGVDERWYADFGVWEFGEATSGPGGAFEGRRLVATVLDGDYPEPAQSLLVRDQSFVVPPAEENPRLRFRHWHSFSYSDAGSAQVRVVGGAWETLQTFTWSSSGGWEWASLDLSRYAGQQVQVGFLFQSRQTQEGCCTWRTYVSSGWYVDDVEVFTGPLVFTNPEGFESAEVWDHWYADNGIWQVGVPTSGPGQAYSGTQVAGTILAGDYAEGYDSRLISPRFVVPAKTLNPRLRYRHWYEFNASDGGRVQIRVEDGDWTTLASYSGDSPAWTYSPPFSLGEYSGMTVQLAFLFQSRQTQEGCCTWRSYVGPGWYLDDVKILSDDLQLNCNSRIELAEDRCLECRATSTLLHPVFGLGLDAPAGARIDPLLGILTWCPTECQGPSTNLITITVTDPDNPTLQPLDYETITVVVLEVNEAPVIGTVPRIGLAAGEPAVFNATQYVYDPDCPAQVLTYSLDQGSPANATIDPVSGVLTWVPTLDQAAQNHTLYLRVTDELGASATREVLVGPVIQGPRIVGIRPDGDAVLLWLEEVTAGQELLVESTSELKNPPPATLWSPVGSPFVWQANPVRLPGVLTGETPQAFFRLVRSP